MQTNYKNTVLPEIGSEDFAAKREKIKHFFEDVKLKAATKEFFEVQLTFHNNMKNLVQTFLDVYQHIRKEDRYQLTELLAPYRVLSQHLFEKPTGNIEEDIARILAVINMENKDFKKALLAFLNSISNLDTFNKFLILYKQNPQLIYHFKQNRHSWLTIEGFVYHPFQNLIRYQHLLEVILKYLAASEAKEEPVLLEIKQALAYLLPEVQNINKCKETIVLLNKIEWALVNLLAQVTLQIETTENMELLSDVKKQIENLLVTLSTSKGKIAENRQNINSLWLGIEQLLEDLFVSFKSLNNKQHTLVNWSDTIKTYLTGARYYLFYLPQRFFNKNETHASLNPLHEIPKLLEAVHRAASISAFSPN